MKKKEPPNLFSISLAFKIRIIIMISSKLYLVSVRLIDCSSDIQIKSIVFQIEQQIFTGGLLNFIRLDNVKLCSL